MPFQSVRLAGELVNLTAVYERYGEEFTGKLLDEFTLKWMDGPASSNTKRAAGLRRWLIDLDSRANASDSPSSFCSVRDKLRACAFTQIEKKEFADALSDFVGRASNLKDRTIFSTGVAATRRPVLEQLSSAIDQLAPSMGWPKIGTLRPALPQIIRGTTPSLGELKRQGPQCKETTQPGNEFALTVARNQKRFKRLREIFEAELERKYDLFKFGERLLARRDLPSAAMLRQAERDLADVTVVAGRKSELPGVARFCFPQSDPEFQLAALLKHIVKNHDGQVSGSPSWANRGIRDLVRRNGGFTRVIELLEGSSRALVAAYGIVLMESGFNVQSCDDLAANPFTGKLSAGRAELYVLGSTKTRPTSKAVWSIIVEGTVQLKSKEYRLSGKQAIDLWLEMSGPIRRRATRESEIRLHEIRRSARSKGSPPRSNRLGGSRVQDLLWILPTGRFNDGEVRKSRAGNFRDRWTGLLEAYKDDPVIGGLAIRRKHIRPTVIQLAATSRSGDLQIASLVANHAQNSTTFQNYLNRPYVRAYLTDQIRKFQRHLEVGLLKGSKSLANKLMYSDEEFASLLTDAKHCGVAFFEDFELAAVDAGPESVDDDCLTAIGYSEADEAMRSAALLRISLDLKQDEYLVRNPQRWCHVWLPLHALAIAVWNLLESGPRAVRFRHIAEETRISIAAGELIPFRPI